MGFLHIIHKNKCAKRLRKKESCRPNGTRPRTLLMISNFATRNIRHKYEKTSCHGGTTDFETEIVVLTETRKKDSGQTFLKIMSTYSAEYQEAREPPKGFPC